MKLSQRMTKVTARGVIAVAGLALLLGATAASANPITSFSYTSHIGFTSWTSTNGNTGTPCMAGSDSSGITASENYGGVVPTGCAKDTLQWGIPSTSDGKSSLAITDPNTNGNVTVGNGVPVPDGTLEHDNNVISTSSDSLTQATITGLFTLTSNDHPVNGTPPGGPLVTPFVISFAETPNVAGTCVAPSPAGNPCNDIFALANANQTILVTFNGGLFGGDSSYNYHLHLGFIENNAFKELDALSHDECDAVGLSAGCVGFTTVEDVHTSKDLGFIITSEKLTKVPEPMPIALFGLGLLMLGVMLRYRRRTGHTD